MAAPKTACVRFAFVATVAALIVALVPSTSRAAEDAMKKDKMPSYPALMKMKPMDTMKMMDGDKSGFVTREEFMKFYEDLFDRLDKDKNQQVTAPEFTDAG
jgi:Ca2+-binding EF-hand superfamily protein